MNDWRKTWGVVIFAVFIVILEIHRGLSVREALIVPVLFALLMEFIDRVREKKRG